MRPGRAFKLVRALDIVVKLGKEVMTSRVRASRDLQGTMDLHDQGSRFEYLFYHKVPLHLVRVVQTLLI